MKVRSILIGFLTAGVSFGAAVVQVLPVAAQDVNDFSISTYDVQLELSRDDMDASILRTIETITAEFPDRDQNRGIERYIPRMYDGHTTNLAIVGVWDQSGSPLHYTTYSSDEYTVLRIGNSDRYVRGTQTYRIEYTQANVTKGSVDGIQEFYWDVNGTEWQVPIESLTATLTIDEAIISKLNDRLGCYSGLAGSKTRCELIKRSSNVFTVSSETLAKKENISVAVGFTSDTFAAYKRPLVEYGLIVLLALQVVALIVAIILMIFYSVRYARWSSRSKDIGTIVPEYLPPPATSVQTSATLVGSLHSFSGQLIDFAVRHYIKIYEIEEKAVFSNAEYEFEIVRQIDDLFEEEKEFIRDVFVKTDVGTKITTKSLRKDTKLASRLRDNPEKLKKLMLDQYELRYTDEEKSAWFKKHAKVLLIIGAVLWPVLIVGGILFVFAHTLRPLTDKGVELHRYLKGLKQYISIAEEERLKMLQSPEGVAKVNVKGDDQKQLVKLYEKVLPYAIIFGQEKQWNTQLGHYYESTNQQPDWYSGAAIAGFSAANFSNAVSNLTTSIDSSGASYSSTGGSTGGGYSGGGGGGGGGGGW